MMPAVKDISDKQKEKLVLFTPHGGAASSGDEGDLDRDSGKNAHH